uniref:Glycosyltransferase family 2 protein n=1 Tax=Oscillatoriales cyanobacterium SpSt-402 TaxID=2282168 RepID=A0A832H5C0_9CYAN
MVLDVCICTHNPRRDIFVIVLNAIANQTLSKDAYKVWVIDNCSTPPVTDIDLLPLKNVGVDYQIVLEPQLGNLHARRRAVEETNGELLVFVDDDNELTSHYLETAVAIAANNPNLGCFGGKLLLASTIPHPKWIEPLLPYLAVRDFGDDIITNLSNHWGEWEPPTAGAGVRRQVLKRYLERLSEIPEALKLGRRGRSGLLSCEDSLMMRGAYDLGLECSYQPGLVLIHHLNPTRFKLLYLLKLMYSYGRSHVILERTLGHSFAPVSWVDACRIMINNIKIRDIKNFFHLMGLVAWDLGYFREVCRNPEEFASFQPQ